MAAAQYVAGEDLRMGDLVTIGPDGTLVKITVTTLLHDAERPCCGTFKGSPHRVTCPQYRGKRRP